MEEAGPAGVDSTLIFENSDNMMELPVIKYDQKQVWIKKRYRSLWRFVLRLSLQSWSPLTRPHKFPTGS